MGQAEVKRAVGTAVLVVVAMSGMVGCSHPTILRIYNQTGAPITVHVVRNPSTQHEVKRREDLVVAHGKRVKVFGYEFEAGEVSAGNCIYDYSAISRSAAMSGMHVAVQIEPDFSAHLLNVEAKRDRVGQFMDEAAPGFPVRPARRCGAAAD